MKDDGGPAFPADGWMVEKDSDEPPKRIKLPGMSLRDYYKAAALTGLLANPDLRNLVADCPNLYSKSSAPNIASVTGHLADAMLKEGKDKS